MKFLIEAIAIFLAIMVFITQVLIPLFRDDLQMFWMFRKGQDFTENKEPVGDLESLRHEVETTVDQYNTTKNKVTHAEKQVQKMKEKIK